MTTRTSTMTPEFANTLRRKAGLDPEPIAHVREVSRRRILDDAGSIVGFDDSVIVNIKDAGTVMVDYDFGSSVVNRLEFDIVSVFVEFDEDGKVCRVDVTGEAADTSKWNLRTSLTSEDPKILAVKDVAIEAARVALEVV